jgi:signal transduction histidine kinase
VRIEIHDTGIGIPPDKVARVFDAFHRLDSNQTDGLGLGLFVVRRAVDLMGHSLDVQPSATDRASRSWPKLRLCASPKATRWKFQADR